MKMKVNLAQFEKWAHEHRRLALAVCYAQAAAEITRDEVDAYINPIFQSFGFVYSGKLAESLDQREGEKFLGKRIESQNELHLCDSPRLQEYFDACDTAHRSHGHLDLPKGHCPALRMEHLLIQAQGILIDAAEPIAGIKRHMLQVPDREQEYLDLLITACLAQTSDNEINSYMAPPDHQPVTTTPIVITRSKK